MNSGEMERYFSIGLILVITLMIIVIIGPFIMLTGAFSVDTSLFIFSRPVSPILRAWTYDINSMGYENGTVFLNWTPSPSEDILNYVLYSTYDYLAGFNFEAPYNIFPNTSTDYIDYDASNNHPEIYYILRAKDIRGLEDENEEVWGKFERSLYSTPRAFGENLISLPVVPFDSSLEKVFIQNDSNIKVFRIYEVNNEAGTTKWSEYFPGYGWWSPYNLYTLTPNKAYWAKANANVTQPFTGEVIKYPQHVPLYLTSRNFGENLVGWTSVVPQTFEEAIKQTPGDYNITRVMKRNDITGNTEWAEYFGVFGWWSPTGLNTFEPGNVYRLKTKTNFTWTYEPNKV